MTRNLLVAGSLALALTACGKGKAGAGGGDCASAVEHMMGLQMDGMPKDLDPETKTKMAQMMGKVKGAVIASCQKEKWTPEAISCLQGLKSADEGKKCDDKLTKEQREAAEKAGEDAAKDPPVGSAK